MRYFARDFTVLEIADLTGLHRNTVNQYVQKIRKKIAFYCEQISKLEGEIECDESYFGGKRKGDKRGE